MPKISNLSQMLRAVGYAGVSLAPAGLVAGGITAGRQAVDSFATKTASAGELLGLQADTDRATQRALSASNVLAAKGRVARAIIDNIGR